MDLIQNYTVAHPNIVKNTTVSKPVSKSIEQNKSTVNNPQAIPDVTPDYNITAPIAYNFVGDIKLSDDLTAKCYKLANGQKIVIVPKDGTTVVKTYVNTGSLNEPDNLRGISHYIEHNLFNGSEALGEKVFFDEVNKMGARTNASTSFSITDYFISSNLLDDNDLEKKIQLHAGMIQSPKFLLDKLEKEKKIVNSEINMCLSNDENIGYTETLKNLFGLKSSSLDLVVGSTNNISSLTRDDVVNYFNNNYYPANMVTVITGEVNPDDTMRLVSKYFNSKKTPVQSRHFEEFVPTQKTVRRDIISQKSEGAASVFLGFAGPENSNTRDQIYLDALSVLMTSLSNSKVSDIERKYSTAVDFEFERLGTRPSDRYATMLVTEVPDNYVEPLLKDIYRVVDNLSKNPPSEDELIAVKNKLKKSFSMRLESSHALNHYVGHSFLNNQPNYLNDFNSILDNMTAKDIADTAKKYLDLNKVALTVVHPSTSNADNIVGNYNSSLSFTGLSKKTPINPDKISEFNMPNNFNVILNDTKSDTVEYRMNIEQKEWSAKKAAVADVLSDMLQNCGTQNQALEKLLSTKDLYGLDTSLGADEYGISLAANFPVNNAEKSLNLIRDMIQKPDLSQEVFEQSLKHCRDYYSTKEVSPYDNFSKVIYKGTPLAITTDEKRESLSEITLDDVKALYNEIFANSQGAVVVSGPFSKNPELKQVVFYETAKYDSVKPKDISLVQTYSPIDKAQVYTVEHKKNYAEIVEGFTFKRNGNVKDSVCLSLLNEILGGSPSSRLFSDLREKRHLTYAVSSDYDSIDDVGVLALSIEPTTENLETGEKLFDNIQKAIVGMNENIEKIKTEKVTEEELEAAKKSLKTSILSAMDINTTRTSVIANSSRTPYGVGLVNKKLELIDTITVDDILNTAKNVFKSKPVYSIAATRGSIEANKAFLESLTA